MIVRDRKLATQDTYFLAQTPLKFLLKDNIDLSRDVKVQNVTGDGATTSIMVEDKATFGGTSHIKLMFDAKNFTHSGNGRSRTRRGTKRSCRSTTSILTKTAGSHPCSRSIRNGSSIRIDGAEHGRRLMFDRATTASARFRNPHPEELATQASRRARPDKRLGHPSRRASGAPQDEAEGWVVDMNLSRPLVAALLLGMALAGPAAAHPHVWVVGNTDVLFDAQGRISGLRQNWSFDDMYSAFATQGVGEKGKPIGREALAPLAQTNVESLAEFGYFTAARTAGKSQSNSTSPAITGSRPIREGHRQPAFHAAAESR